MRLLLYEFITGGGAFHLPSAEPPAGSLLSEGAAMRDAAVRDFAAARHEVVWLHDARLPLLPLPGDAVAVHSADDEERTLRRLARDLDGMVLIAPEFDGLLLTRCRWIEEEGGRLLSPGSSFVAVASDKQATAERLAAAGVAVPHGVRLVRDQPAPRDFPLPAVLKPIDGAGSLHVRRVDSQREIAAHRREHPQVAAWRLEAFAPGIAASIAALGDGRGGWLLLPPALQRLSDDGRFTYLGGELPLDDALVLRARPLAEQALAALPPASGYVGIDLVLGPRGDLTDDVVIEVNPRLTTSYVGLRRLLSINLASSWLALIADDAPRPNLDRFAAERRIVFAADGAVSANGAGSDGGADFSAALSSGGRER